MSNTNVAVALLYETQELGRHLRDALTSLGTPIVYEAAPANLDLVALENSGARVVVVNLDPDVEAHLDDVYGLLEDDRYSVVFNDAQASSALSGWDQARWARHLASKILGDVDIDPPRPYGAESVPAPAAALHAAPADEAEPTDIELASEPEAGYDVRVRSIIENAHEEHAPMADASNPLDRLESRYEEMSQPADAGYRTPTPPSVDAFDFSTLEALTASPVPPAATSPALTFAPEFLDEVEPAPTPVAEPVDASPPAHTFASEFEIESAPLEEIEMPAVPTPATDDFDLADLDKLFGDEPFASFESATIESEPVESVSIESVSIESDSVEPDSIGTGAIESASIETLALDVGDLGDFANIEVIELDDGIEEVEPSLAAPSTLSLADDITFDAPPARPIEPIASPEISMKLAAAADWSLEDMLEGEEPPPVPQSTKPSARPAPTGPADFGIEKVSAAEYLAPSTENTAPPAMPDTDFSLELMPMEEAVAPQPIEQKSHEAWLDPDKVVVPQKIRKVWVLGASIGGPEAVRDFLRELPRDYPALFLLAQHMGVEFVDLMAQQLAKATSMTVRTPTHGERVSHGEILIVPTTHRMQVDPEGIVVLERTSNEGAYSPSIDQVLRDVADRYGANAGAIIFSGMTTDSVEGSKYLAGKGGTIYAQHPDSCVVSSMIDGVVDAGVVKFLGAPRELAELLLSEAGKTKR